MRRLLHYRQSLKPSALAAVEDLLVRGPRLLVPSTSSIGPENNQPLASGHNSMLRGAHKLSTYCNRHYASQVLVLHLSNWFNKLCQMPSQHTPFPLRLPISSDMTCSVIILHIHISQGRCTGDLSHEEDQHVVD